MLHVEECDAHDLALDTFQDENVQRILREGLGADAINDMVSMLKLFKELADPTPPALERAPDDTDTAYLLGTAAVQAVAPGRPPGH